MRFWLKRSKRTFNISFCFIKVKIFVITVHMFPWQLIQFCFSASSLSSFIMQTTQLLPFAFFFFVVLQMPGNVCNPLPANSLFQSAEWSVNWFHESVFALFCTELVICGCRQQSSERQSNWTTAPQQQK